MRRACIPVTRTPPRSATSASRTPSFECGGGRTPSRTSTAPSGSRAPPWCCSRPITTAGTRPGCAGTSRGRTTSSQAARSCAGTVPRRLLAAHGPLAGPGAVVEQGRTHVLLLFGGGGWVAVAAHRCPDRRRHLVLAAVQAASADRAGVAVRLALGDGRELGWDAHLRLRGAALGRPELVQLVQQGGAAHAGLDQVVVSRRAGGREGSRHCTEEKRSNENSSSPTHVLGSPRVCRGHPPGGRSTRDCSAGMKAGGGIRRSASSVVLMDTPNVCSKCALGHTYVIEVCIMISNGR